MPRINQKTYSVCLETELFAPIFNYNTDHMLCLKISSGLVRILDPSGAEGLPVLFSLVDSLLKTLATLVKYRLHDVCIYSVKLHEGMN